MLQLAMRQQQKPLRWHQLPLALLVWRAWKHGAKRGPQRHRLLPAQPAVPVVVAADVGEVAVVCLGEGGVIMMVIMMVISRRNPLPLLIIIVITTVACLPSPATAVLRHLAPLQTGAAATPVPASVRMATAAKAAVAAASVPAATAAAMAMAMAMARPRQELSTAEAEVVLQAGTVPSLLPALFDRCAFKRRRMRLQRERLRLSLRLSLRLPQASRLCSCHLAASMSLSLRRFLSPLQAYPPA